jgi:hypothetical protein
VRLVNASSEEPSALVENAEINGDFAAFPERLVLAPTQGRLLLRQLREGQTVRDGDVVGTIHRRAGDVPIISPWQAVFVGWLVGDGDYIATGVPVLRLRPAVL